MARVDQLQPWRELLAPLVPGLAEALLPWLERLDLAVGPMASEEPLADGDPDGFLGLSRRGPYERLLLTEWLLSTEAPDEFVRRAASGEHAFLELARRSTAGSRVTAVFFDAGPSQLGSPRVAQLALLLVMARRAQAAGARFYWGVLQQPEVLRESAAPDQALALLAGRSRAEPDEAMARACAAHPALAGARRELWLVGGAAARGLAPGPFVEVGEPVELTPSRLVARVRRPDRGSLEVDLPLPPEEQRVRLLRDPFERPARPARHGASGPAAGGREALFFSDNGRRLFVALADGGFAAYPIHNSPYVSPAGDPLIFRPPAGQSVLAAGWSKNQAAVLLCRGKALLLRRLGRKGGPSGEATEYEGDPPPGTGPLVPLFKMTNHRGLTDHAFLAPEGGVVQLDGAGKVTSRQGVVAAAQVNFQLVMACLEPPKEGHVPPGEGLFFEVEQPAQVRRQLDTVVPGRTGAVFFGYADGAGRHPELGLCAVERPPLGEWAILCGPRQDSVVYLKPPEGQVVGVYHGHSEPKLLVLAVDRLRLLAVGPSGVISMVTTTSPITSVAASPVAHSVAYLTEARELVVISHYHTQPLLKVTHDQAP